MDLKQEFRWILCYRVICCVNGKWNFQKIQNPFVSSCQRTMLLCCFTSHQNQKINFEDFFWKKSFISRIFVKNSVSLYSLHLFRSDARNCGWNSHCGRSRQRCWATFLFGSQKCYNTRRAVCRPEYLWLYGKPLKCLTEGPLKCLTVSRWNVLR